MKFLKSKILLICCSLFSITQVNASLLLLSGKSTTTPNDPTYSRSISCELYDDHMVLTRTLSGVSSQRTIPLQISGNFNSLALKALETAPTVEIVKSGIDENFLIEAFYYSETGVIQKLTVLDFNSQRLIQNRSDSGRMILEIYRWHCPFSNFERTSTFRSLR